MVDSLVQRKRPATTTTMARSINPSSTVTSSDSYTPAPGTSTSSDNIVADVTKVKDIQFTIERGDAKVTFKM